DGRSSSVVVPLGPRTLRFREVTDQRFELPILPFLALITKALLMIMYSQQFYDRIEAETVSSATVIVPLILDLLPLKSVVDVGCGRGLWLDAFASHGIQEILGIDGPWVTSAQLAIPEDRFVMLELDKPWALDKRFDIALCLEVGEHLPRRASSLLV